MERNPQRITRKHRNLANKLDYERINVSVSKKDYCKIEMQNKICIKVFHCDNKWTYPAYLSDKKFNDDMDLLLISNEFKSDYVYIKDLCLIRLKIEIRNIFVSVVYSVSVVKKY